VIQDINRYTLNKIKDNLRKTGYLKRKNRLDNETVQKAKEELQDLIASSYKPKLTARKMNERMSGKIAISLTNKLILEGTNDLDELLLGAKAIFAEMEDIK
jgi:NH3-dependent NAD+ synthetase